MDCRKRFVAAVTIFLLLLVTVGCQHSKDKPLWERLDQAQYDRYKPRLEHMIEKYGEEFTMDNYGTVFSVEHPEWSFNVKYLEQSSCIRDNYIVFIRRDEIKEIITNILSDIYGELKISVLPEWYAPSDSTKDTTAEELLSAAAYGEGNCMVIICYTTADVETRDEDFLKAINAVQDNGFCFTLAVRYTNGEIFSQIPDNHYAEFPMDMARYYYITRSYMWGKEPLAYEWEEGQLSELEEAGRVQ